MKKNLPLALIFSILSACFVNAQNINVLQVTGLNSQHQGIFAWNVRHAKFGHLIPAPYNLFGNDTAYYYLATTDYGTFDPLSTTGMHGFSTTTGFTNLQAALAANNRTIYDINVRFATSDLGNDVNGVDWNIVTNGMQGIETRTYKNGTFVILLNNDTLFTGAMPNTKLVIDYGTSNPRTPYDDVISAVTNYVVPTKASSNALTDAIATAFLKDIENKGIRFNFTSLQPAGQTEFDNKQIFGAFFNITAGKIESSSMVIPHFGSNLSVCQGDSLLLDAGAGKSHYLWSTGATTQRIYVKQAGNYFVNVDSAGIYGQSASVNVTVSPKPQPQFDASLKNDICYTAGIIYLNGSDALSLGGVEQFSTDGVLNTNKTIALEDRATVSTDKKYIVKYLQTSPKGCKDSIYKTITVHYVAPPVTTNFNYKVIGVGAAPTISATPLTSGNTIQWYDATKTGTLTTGSIYTDPTDRPEQSTPYFFYATQTQSFGSLSCESQPALATIKYQNCQADLPSAQNREMCIYDNIPSFSITRGSKSVATHAYEIQVFTPQAPNSGTPAITTVSSSTMVYDPTPQISSHSVGEVKQFWIAEYDLTDKCMGPAHEISLTIKATQAPVAVANAPFCQATQTSVTLSISNVLTGTEKYWYDNTANTAAEPLGGVGFLNKIQSYTIGSTNTLAAGTYTYYASQFQGGCQSPKVPVSFTIIPKPVPPTLDSAWSCENLPYNELKAKKISPNYTVNWYTNYDTSLLKQADTYTPTGLTPGGSLFKATQTSVESCTSDATTVKYILFAKPAAPIFVKANQRICDYDKNMPTYTVSNATGTITWTESGLTATGTTHTPQKPTPPILVNNFTATQEENTCVSDPGTANLEMIPKPSAPRVSQVTPICANEEVKPLVAQSVGANTIHWYKSLQDIGTNNFVMAASFTPSPLKQPSISEPNALTSLYATQVTSDGYACESEPTTATVTISNKKRPIVNVRGDSMVCENTTKVTYYITPQDTSNTFTWKISGKTVSYLPPIAYNRDLFRQVDWTAPGFDTIVVSESNGVCIGYDSLIVRIAPHAKPSFETTVTNNTISFLNTTPRPIITENGVKDTVDFLYFNWNFNRVTKYVNQSNYSYKSDSILSIPYQSGFMYITLRALNEYCFDTVSITLNNGKTGVSIPETSSGNIKLSPNPASTSLHIQASSDETGKGTLKIYNIIGVLVYEKTMNSVAEVDETVSVASLPVGIYSVVIESANGAVSRLITVKR